MMSDILVMDCEEREAFWITLKGDYHIHFVATAEEGLEMLSENIGLVFLNLRLPDMNGTEVLHRIKKEYPSLPVIIITSCGREEMCSEVFGKGTRDCPGKSLSAEELLRKMRILMDSNDASQRHQHAALPTELPEEEHYPDIPPHLIEGVLKVRDFITQHYAETLTLHDACRMASTSKTYFCHFFKRITGYSLRTYQHVVKVQRAEELLRNSDLTIIDVALRLGYNDANYFSTIYKKITGSSPKHGRASGQRLEKNKEELNRI